jgi:hypothetical protein
MYSLADPGSSTAAEARLVLLSAVALVTFAVAWRFHALCAATRVVRKRNKALQAQVDAHELRLKELGVNFSDVGKIKSARGGAKGGGEAGRRR